jgi:hypothetical protein
VLEQRLLVHEQRLFMRNAVCFSPMRTTLNIDEDVLWAAREMAAVRGTSTGRALSELARQALSPSDGEPAARNGVPLLPKRPGERPVSMEVVRPHTPRSRPRRPNGPGDPSPGPRPKADALGKRAPHPCGLKGRERLFSQGPEALRHDVGHVVTEAGSARGRPKSSGISILNKFQLLREDCLNFRLDFP